MSQSHLEEQFLGYLAIWSRVSRVTLPEPVREHRFCHRRWRFDFAWLTQRVAVEVQGGIWAQGRHSRAAGMAADYEKHNQATRQGWRVLYVVPAQLRSAFLFETIVDLLKENS